MPRDDSRFLKLRVDGSGAADPKLGSRENSRSRADPDPGPEPKPDRAPDPDSFPFPFPFPAPIDSLPGPGCWEASTMVGFAERFPGCVCDLSAVGGAVACASALGPVGGGVLVFLLVLFGPRSE